MKHSNQSIYDRDFYAWAIRSAALIREGRFAELDAQHVAEEIEDMGKRYRRELLNRLAILLAHLLKYKFQIEKRSKSWKITIRTQRFDLHELLEESPSLTYELEAHFQRAYQKAKLLAINETGLTEKDFPALSPFTLEQCLNSEFFGE